MSRNTIRSIKFRSILNEYFSQRHELGIHFGLIQYHFGIPSSYFFSKPLGEQSVKEKFSMPIQYSKDGEKRRKNKCPHDCGAVPGYHGSLGIKNEPVAFSSLDIQIVPWEGFQLLIPKIECQKLFQSIQFENVQVYDYDWGLRDDFMGEASLPLGQLVPQKKNDLVLTLAEPGLTSATDYEHMKPIPQLLINNWDNGCSLSIGILRI